MRAKKGKKPKAKKIVGRDATSQLYRAVIRYVESKGGKLLVIGGVQVQEWPEDAAYKFRLAVGCLGRKPVLDVKRAGAK